MKVIELIKKYDLSAKKKFGQNFLVDELLLDKIVLTAGNIANTNVLEIGAGPGGLTYSILKQKPKVSVSFLSNKRLNKAIETCTLRNVKKDDDGSYPCNELLASTTFIDRCEMLIKYNNELRYLDENGYLLERKN